jgi:hypothetical protein
MSISKALSKTVSAITGFAGNLTRAAFGLDNPSASPSKKPDKKTKGSVKNTEPIDSGALSSANKVMGMIYGQLVKARQSELLHREELQSKAEDKKRDDEKRNGEIIKALTIKIKPTKKLQVKNKPTTPKVEPTTPKVQPTTPKVQPTTPKVQPTTPKVQPTKPKIEKVTPKTTIKEPPKQPEKINATPNISSVKPSVGGTVLTGAAGLIGAILSHESYGGNVNAYNYNISGKKYGGGKDRPNDKLKPGKNISEMTVGEIKEEQAKRNLFAVGKWQMVPNTFNEGVNYVGLKDTDLFDETNQNKMWDFFTHKKRPKIGMYLEGKGNVSKDEAVTEIAKEWASVGVPHDMQGNKQFVTKGQTYYLGDGINRAHTSPDLIANMLDQSKSNKSNTNSASKIESPQIIPSSGPSGMNQTTDKIYALGDSHAALIAGNSGKAFVNMAIPGSRSSDSRHLENIKKVPDGSTVILSLGHNDGGVDPEKTIQNIKKIIEIAKKKNIKVNFVGFPLSDKANLQLHNKIQPIILQGISQSIQSTGGSIFQVGTIKIGSTADAEGIHAKGDRYKELGKEIINGKPKAEVQILQLNSDAVEQSSKENINLKSSMNNQSQTNVNNTIVAPTNDDQTSSIPKKKIDDRPAIQRK